MAVTDGRKKKPPSFHYLPKNRAKRLRKSWIEDHKIRSKWRAQKEREGLTNQTSVPAENTSNHPHDEITVDSELDASPDRPDESLTPPRDKQSLRDLRRTIYASKPPHTQKTDFSCEKRCSRRFHLNHGGRTAVGRETGQPDMKLRMDVLLEQIKRDFS